MDAKKRIQELREIIKYHADLYYNQDAPEISDFEYDMLLQELKNLEMLNPDVIVKDSPTQVVQTYLKVLPIIELGIHI